MIRKYFLTSRTDGRYSALREWHEFVALAKEDQTSFEKSRKRPKGGSLPRNQCWKVHCWKVIASKFLPETKSAQRSIAMI
jgi:hypothetical protein